MAGGEWLPLHHFVYFLFSSTSLLMKTFLPRPMIFLAFIPTQDREGKASTGRLCGA